MCVCVVLGHDFSYSGRLGMVLGLGFKFRVRWAAGVGSRVYRLMLGALELKDLRFKF